MTETSINISVSSEQKPIEEFSIPYICCICGQQFDPNPIIIKQLQHTDFWIRYAAQLVNHARHNHMSTDVHNMRQSFEANLSNKDKKFDINNTRRIKLNNIIKLRLLNEIEKKMPRSMSQNIIVGMRSLGDNNKKINKEIDERIKKYIPKYTPPTQTTTSSPPIPSSPPPILLNTSSTGV